MAASNAQNLKKKSHKKKKTQMRIIRAEDIDKEHSLLALHIIIRK